MAITLGGAPQQSVNELKNAMDWFSDHKSKATAARSLLDATGGSQNIAHKIFNLDRDKIIGKKGLAAAQMVGWRYVIKDDANQFHVAEVGANEKDNTHAFNSFNQGAHLNSFLTHFNDFGQNELLQGKDYELNILRIPSCFVMAIWLKEKSHNDLFIPLDPIQNGFTAGKTYNTADFMKIIEGLAAESAKQVDRDSK